MSPYMKKIRQFAKKIIAYEIRGEDKVYRLKCTPIQVKRHYTRMYHKELEQLPIEPRKIVFDNYMGRGYGCNGKYVTQALLAMDKDLDIVWTVKDPKEQREDFPEQVRLVQYASAEAVREYATAGVWVANYHIMQYLHKGLLKKPDQTYIQMWHGSFGIKKIENDCSNLTQDKNWTYLAKKNSRYTDYWISNSGFETDVYRRAFWDVGEVLEYGHPRNDLFFHGKENDARLAVEQYVCRNQCKFLLYVPTFRDDLSDWEEPLDYGRLAQNLKERFGGEWVILLRIHPRMKAYAKETMKEGCIDVTEYPDIQELLAAADAVITDYSSAVFDFLLTRRPAFIYATDYGNYQQMRGLYYPLEETPFPIATSNGQLAENIADFDENAYQKKAEAFLLGKESKEDGHAAERVAKLIMGCIDKNEEKQK